MLTLLANSRRSLANLSPVVSRGDCGQTRTHPISTPIFLDKAIWWRWWRGEENSTSLFSFLSNAVVLSFESTIFMASWSPLHKAMHGSEGEGKGKAGQARPKAYTLPLLHTFRIHHENHRTCRVWPMHSRPEGMANTHSTQGIRPKCAPIEDDHFGRPIRLPHGVKFKGMLHRRWVGLLARTLSSCLDW